MPTLKNARHEKFAQALFKGKSAEDAYVEAGFKPDRGNASRLQRNDSIRQRIDELLEWEQAVERKATEKAVEKLAITKERVLAELAKIGFSDIRRVVKWQSGLVTEEDNTEGGDVAVIKTVVTNNVHLVSSEEVDDDTAVAIAEISQTSTGGLKVKLHDKRAALVDMGKHLGMFIERRENNNTNFTISSEPLTEDEWLEQNAPES